MSVEDRKRKFVVTHKRAKGLSASQKSDIGNSLAVSCGKLETSFVEFSWKRTIASRQRILRFEISEHGVRIR